MTVFAKASIEDDLRQWWLVVLSFKGNPRPRPDGFPFGPETVLNNIAQGPPYLLRCLLCGRHPVDFRRLKEGGTLDF
jgi:hypothetical protein